MVSEAVSLKASLERFLEETRPVTLDIAGLQRIDTAGLQVIAAFVRERSAHGLRVEWRGSSAPLAKAARLLGLASLLNLPA